MITVTKKLIGKQITGTDDRKGIVRGIVTEIGRSKTSPIKGKSEPWAWIEHDQDGDVACVYWDDILSVENA